MVNNITDKLYKSCVKDASKMHETNSANINTVVKQRQISTTTDQPRNLLCKTIDVCRIKCITYRDITPMVNCSRQTDVRVLSLDYSI